MVAGPPIGVSVVSISRGPMVLAFTWQEGVVDEDLVRRVAAYVKRRLETPETLSGL